MVQEGPLSLDIVSTCLPRPINFSFRLQNATLFSQPAWWTHFEFALVLLVHNDFPYVANNLTSSTLHFSIKLPRKWNPPQPLLISFIPSSTLVIPLAYPASSFPHLCSQFHFNFLRLLLPPQTFHRIWLPVLVHPNYKVNPHCEDGFTILHRFIHDLKVLSLFTASCSSGCQVFEGFLACINRTAIHSRIAKESKKWWF